jgi:hypothetical protein
MDMLSIILKDLNNLQQKTLPMAPNIGQVTVKLYPNLFPSFFIRISVDFRKPEGRHISG